MEEEGVDKYRHYLMEVKPAGMLKIKNNFKPILRDNRNEKEKPKTVEKKDDPEEETSRRGDKNGKVAKIPRKIDALDVDPKIIDQQPLSYRLGKIPQLKLFDYYFGPFIEEKVEPEECEDEKKEIESMKNIMVTIGKLKGENEKCLDRIYDTKKKTEASKKKVYQELFRKNLKKIFDNLRTIQNNCAKFNIDVEKFGDLRKERTFRAIKYDPEEIRTYLKNAKDNHRQARSLLDIDVVEARGIYNPENTISSLVDLMSSYKVKGQLDKLRDILKYPLIGERKVRNFVDTLEALSQFMNKLFFENVVTKRMEENADNEPEESKYQTKQEREAKSAQAEAYDKFFTFFPFWDTKFCEGSREDSVFLRKQLGTSVPDCLNLSEVLKCETIREVITFYQQNRESQNIGAFTQDEMYKLEQRGLDKLKAENVRNLIGFLSKQSRMISPELFEFLNPEKPKHKIDLRGISLGRLSCISAIFCSVINMRHPVKRIDLTGFGSDEDIGNVLNLYISNKKFNFKELQCNENALEHGGFIIFYKNLSKTNIEVVSLNKCGIPFETSFLIPNFIESADNLRVLSLESNLLKDNVGAIILQHVSKSKNLRYINLSNNPLEDQSINELCNLLEKNRSLECVEYENTIIGEHMIPSFKGAFGEVHNSNLKVLKLGTFKKSDVDYSMIFRQGFSKFKHLSLGTITVHTDLKDQEMSLTTILQENRSLYVVNHFISKPREELQSACLTFFGESILLAKSEMNELLDCYQNAIKKSEDNYELKLIPNLSYIWHGFARKPVIDAGLERESKEKLLVRYFLAILTDKYDGIVQLEVIYLALKYLVTLNGYFEDGFSMIHKIILSRNNILLEECFKIGLSLSTDTCDTNSFLPVITSLQLILISGNVAMLQRMLTYKPNVDHRDQYGNTLLHYACLYGEADVVKRLIELNCEANAENSLGMQPLHTAVIGDSIECFLLVLNHLGKKTMVDNFIISQIPATKQNCLHLAVIFSSNSVFNYCLDVLENLNLQDAGGRTAMMYSVEKGNIIFVRRLLQNGADPHLYDSNGNNLLFYLLNIWGNLKRTKGDNFDDEEISSLFKMVLSHYGNEVALYKNRDKEDLLYTAAKNNIPNIMINFLEMGIKPNEINVQGVCAVDLIHKNPQLTAAYLKWKRKGLDKTEEKIDPYATKKSKDLSSSIYNDKTDRSILRKKVNDSQIIPPKKNMSPGKADTSKPQFSKILQSGR